MSSHVTFIVSNIEHLCVCVCGLLCIIKTYENLSFRKRNLAPFDVLRFARSDNLCKSLVSYSEHACIREHLSQRNRVKGEGEATGRKKEREGNGRTREEKHGSSDLLGEGKDGSS